MSHRYSQMSFSRKRLVLHFDLNTTVLMKDSAKDIKSIQYTVARVITKSSWGTIVNPEAEEGADESKPPTWRLKTNQLSWSKPEKGIQEKSKTTGENFFVDLIDYNTYLNQTYPTKDVTDEVRDSNKETQTRLILNFAKEGGPGEKFMNIYSRMQNAMDLPMGAKATLNLPEELIEKIQNGQPLWEEKTNVVSEGEEEEDMEDDLDKPKGPDALTDEQKLLMTMYGEGKWHLIPSFFRTMICLKKQKKDFHIAFRTFGDDLQDIIYEFNSFCSGTHPCFNGQNGSPLIKFDGTDGSKDYRIQTVGQKICNFRNSPDLIDARMFTGVDKRPSKNYEEMQYQINNDEKYEESQIIMNVCDQYNHISSTLKKTNSIAVQEDYQGWKDNEFHREAAKLLLIDQADLNVQHIFFDDNADEGESCIVDTRDVVTNEILPYKKQMGRYVCKVDPIKAILEPDYFIQQIEKCEASRDAEIKLVEQGIEEEDLNDPEKQQESEWEKIQKLPNDEYLMRTILPVLYEGMTIMEQTRPVAPMEYLALYILQHQKKITLPPRITTSEENK